jgi:hypothetical protein
MINLTTEQAAIISAAKTGDNLVIEAGAGTGKTSTLVEIARALDEFAQRGLYIAYNKAIQTDAERKFPSNVLCKTAHSIAYGWTMKQQGGKQLIGRLRINVKPWDAVRILGIPSVGFTGTVSTPEGDKARHISDQGIATAVNTTITRFCNSADTEVTAYHVPREFEGNDQKQFETLVLGFARKAWADLTSPTGSLKFFHDVYLKMWSLSKPILNFDFILFDEAQDANPAISSVIEVQPNQVIMVGDSAQAIYGWRGAVDAMSRFKDMGATVLTLSQSFRFGEAIAAEANRFLDLLDAALRLKGFEQTDSTVGEVEEPDAILCRTNASVIEYAMDAQARDRKVAIVGGTKEIETFAKNADKLINGGKVFSGDLAGFDSWEDVRTFSQQEDGKDLRVMVKLVDTYGIPAILEVCQNSTSEGDADVIVSTAHKAKGREWDSVKIAADFLRNTDGEEPSRAELMLMYVAVTRAKVNLDQGVLALV